MSAIDPERAGGTGVDGLPRTFGAPEMTFEEAQEYRQKLVWWRSVPYRSCQALNAYHREVERLLEVIAATERLGNWESDRRQMWAKAHRIVTGQLVEANTKVERLRTEMEDDRELQKRQKTAWASAHRDVMAENEKLRAERDEAIRQHQGTLNA